MAVAAPEVHAPLTEPLSPTEFRKRLEAEIRGRHSAVSRFSLAWTNGELTREQFGEWARQHYHYVGPFSEWLAAMYSKCPHRDAKDFLLQNMWEEEMGQRHTDLLIQFAEACGMTREKIESADKDGQIYPETRSIASWGRDLATNHTYLEATAGAIVGLESQVPAIYMKQLPVLKEKYGFTDEEVKFFKVHITSDIIHGERGYQIVLKYATTADEQQRCIEVVAQGTQQRRLYMDGLYRHAVVGEPF